jgi:hypothetical protein
MVVAVVWWPLSGTLGSQQAAERTATATVVASAPCGAATAGDVVQVPVNGTTRQAHLDGCGHTQGQQLQVQVPVAPGSGDLVVRPSVPGESSSAESTPNRLSWVLLTLATIAGGGYMLLLRSRPAA